MASITVPGVVDNVQEFAQHHQTTVTTHPSTDRPAITVQLKEATGNPATFTKDQVVNVTIATV